MSLCIVKIINGDLRINADSLLSGSGVRRHDIVTDSALKAILLSEKTCLCFAGNPDYITDVYEFIKVRPKIPLQPFTKLLHDLNVKSSGAVEFILAGYVNFDEPYIWEFKDGKVQSTLSSWIGSKKGFDVFQTTYLSENESRRKDAVEHHFDKAFEAVINDDKVPEVGDFHFTVYTTRAKQEHFKRHKFLIYRSIVKIVAQLPAGFGEVSTIMKTETNTNYAISYVPSKDLLNPGLGIHFGHVNYGFLFKPCADIKPIVYSNVNGAQFKEAARKEGIQLNDVPLSIAFNNFYDATGD